jgi:hypothetical protein
MAGVTHLHNREARAQQRLQQCVDAGGEEAGADGLGQVCTRGKEVSEGRGASGAGGIWSRLATRRRTFGVAPHGWDKQDGDQHGSAKHGQVGLESKHDAQPPGGDVGDSITDWELGRGQDRGLIQE